MDRRHSKLGATFKWSAHADWWNQGGDGSVASTIRPWRNQSLWRITNTKRAEELVDQPKCGVQQQYGSLLKKHAIVHTKMMKEYEDWKVAGNGKEEDFEAKERGWKETLEEIFSLVKEFKGNACADGQILGKRAEEGQKLSHKEVE